mgnify:CR=1 FL=1
MVNTTRRVEIWHFLRICFHLRLPSSMFSNQLREKMPCQSIPVNGKLLAGCGKKKPSGEPGTPVSQGKEIRAGEVYGSTVRFRLPDKRRGTLSGGTDGCVPFVLPPDVRLRPCSLPESVGNGRRDGTARAPRFKRKTVKSLSPTLGIAGESPQHSEDLQRKARPEGERPNNRPQKLLLSIP